MIKEFGDIFGGFLAENFNECLGKGFFPDELKCEKLSQCIKRIKDKKDKNNYRPVSLLSNTSKLYERCTYQQINEYFESILSRL